jgi:hypothetical protein
LSIAVAFTDPTTALFDQVGANLVSPQATKGPVREAVLADPEGATFRVGHYDPSRTS